MNLTKRQAEIMDGVIEGLTSAQIAEILHVAPKTIMASRYQSKKRLGAFTSEHAAVLWEKRRALEKRQRPTAQALLESALRLARESHL